MEIWSRCCSPKASKTETGLGMISCAKAWPSPIPITQPTEWSPPSIGLLKSANSSWPRIHKIRKAASRTTSAWFSSGTQLSKPGQNSTVSANPQSLLLLSTPSPTPLSSEVATMDKSFSGISEPSPCPSNGQVSQQTPTNTLFAGWASLEHRLRITLSLSPTTGWCACGTPSNSADPPAPTDYQLTGLFVSRRRPSLHQPTVLLCWGAMSRWLQRLHQFWKKLSKTNFTTSISLALDSLLVTPTTITLAHSMEFFIEGLSTTRPTRRWPCSTNTMDLSAAYLSTTRQSSTLSMV